MAVTLFLIFFKIGLFCFGGGNAMIGQFEHQLVTEFHFLTPTQFADIVAISQITPGPVAINLATYVGAAMGTSTANSIFLAFMATLGMALPGFVLVLAIAALSKAIGESKPVAAALGGIKPAIIGLVVGTGLVLSRFSIYDPQALATKGLGAISLPALLLTAATFIVTTKTKVNPVAVLIVCGIAGIFIL